MSTAPLLQAKLGPEDRAEYLRDLSALVEMKSAQIEEDAGTRACRLDEAFAALESGTAHRVLLRYGYDGRIWMDTLIPDHDGVRLVRIAEDDILPE